MYVRSSSVRNDALSGDDGKNNAKNIPNIVVTEPKTMYSKRHDATAVWVNPNA